MVAVGIGAGVIIVLMEVVYYRRKGMRREQMNIAAKCAEQWKATTTMGKEKRLKEHNISFKGVNGIEMNGHHNNTGFDSDNGTVNK